MDGVGLRISGSVRASSGTGTPPGRSRRTRTSVTATAPLCHGENGFTIAIGKRLPGICAGGSGLGNSAGNRHSEEETSMRMALAIGGALTALFLAGQDARAQELT